MNLAEDPIGAHVTTLAAEASTALVGRMAGRGFQFAGQIVLAHLLGPALFGLYAIGWTILRLVEVTASLGLDSGVIRFGSEYWNADLAGLKNVILKALSLAISSGAIAGIGFYIAAPWMAEQVFQKPDLVNVIRGFAIAFPLITGVRVTAASLRISQRIRFSIFAEDISVPVANLALFLLFYLLNLGLFGAVAAAVGALGITLAVALAMLGNLLGSPAVLTVQTRALPPTSTRDLLRFSLSPAVAAMISLFMVFADRLLIGYFRSETEVGIYQAVAQMSAVFGLILSAFNAIFAPMIAHLYAQKDGTGLNEIFRISTKWGVYVSLPLFMIFCMSSSDVLTVFFGPAYASGALPMVILSIAQLVNLATGAVGLLLIMTDHQDEWLRISVPMFIVDVALCWLLIPHFGIIGAAVATSTAVTGLFMIGLFWVKRTLGLWPYDRRYFKGLMAGAVAGTAVFLLRWLNIATAGRLVIMGVVAYGLFAGVLLLLGLESEDQELLRLLWSRLRSLHLFPGRR